MAIFVLAMAGLIATIPLSLRHQNAILSRISAVAGGNHRGSKGSATLRGTRFDYQYKTGGRYAPPTVIVSVPVASGARFRVKKKDFGMEFLHAIGLAEVRDTSAAVRTGDAGFDGPFFLGCDSADTGQRLFSSPGNSDIVRRIFERGGRFLAHDGTRVAAWVGILKRAEEFDPAVVTRIVPLLAELAASIRENARPAPTPLPAHILWPRRIAIAASAVFAIAAVVAFAGYSQYRPLDGWDLALASLSVSLPVGALVAVVALRAPEGTKLLGYLAGALFALPLIGWWGGGWLNGALDRGPPTVHVALVVDKYTTGDYPKSFYVTLASWRPDREDVELKDERLFGVVQSRRSLVAVTTMPGFFGFEWISSALNRGPAPGQEPRAPHRRP